MGLDIRTAEFLLACRAQGVDFAETVTLGRQSIKLSQTEMERVRTATGVDLSRAEYAEPFFAHLGARVTESIDSSSYEGATLLLNLNAEPPAELLGRFSCVLDGGTLEHIFDFPTALATCLRLVRLGGHFLAGVAANNLMGHGFYQFSPELFWSTLGPENGFAIESMYLYADRTWYAVASPLTLGGRVQAVTHHETYLFVCARKVSEKALFVTAPHQSDYVGNLQGATPVDGPEEAGWKERCLRAAPWLRPVQEHWRALKYLRDASLRNERFFTKLGHRLPGEPLG